MWYVKKTKCVPYLPLQAGMKKSTAVYIITTDQNRRQPSRSPSPRRDEINFHVYNDLKGKKDYKFKETITKTSALDPTKQLVGEIEVDLDRRGTHVTVDANKYSVAPTRPHSAGHYRPSSPSRCARSPRLISSQTFNTGRPGQSCIRRYVFEIPVDGPCNNLPLTGHGSSPNEDCLSSTRGKFHTPRNPILNNGRQKSTKV